MKILHRCPPILMGLVFLILPTSLPAQSMPSILPHPCTPEAGNAAAALFDSCESLSNATESLKVSLARALFPDSPFLESIVGDVWPYEWEGMICQQVNLTPAPGNELLVLLYLSGQERSVSVTVLEHFPDRGWRRYDTQGNEEGIQNTLFLLGDTDLLDRLSTLAVNDTSAPMPWTRDLDGDGQSELIIHGSTTGYVGEERSGPLYWPEIYTWRDGAFVDISDDFPEVYKATVLPLYQGILDDLQADWENAGRIGEQPTVARIKQIRHRLAEIENRPKESEEAPPGDTP